MGGLHTVFSFSLLIILFHFETIHINASSCKCNRATQNQTAVKAAYWISDSSTYMPLSRINASLFSHIIYSSGYVDQNNAFRVTVSEGKEATLASFTTKLQYMNVDVKTLFSIGGNTTNATVFSLMAENSTLRKNFIESGISTARQYGFHGMDLDWRYPSDRKDMVNFGYLLIECKAMIQEEAIDTSMDPLILTSSVYFSEQYFDGIDKPGYPVQAIVESLDWVNVMSFGYHGGAYNNHTRTNAGLYDITSHFSTSYGIGSWLDSDVPPHKIVLGFPLFGESWILKNKNKTYIGAPAVAAGPRQKRSKKAGFIGFSEIHNFVLKNNASVVVDNATVSAYCYAKGIWISFDNEETISLKTMFAMEKGLLGYFFWPLTYDLDSSLPKSASKMWDGYCDSKKGDRGGSSNDSTDGSPWPSPPPTSAKAPSGRYAVSSSANLVVRFRFIFLFIHFVWLL